jgi:hypothetical protein
MIEFIFLLPIATGFISLVLPPSLGQDTAPDNCTASFATHNNELDGKAHARLLQIISVLPLKVY